MSKSKYTCITKKQIEDEYLNTDRNLQQVADLFGCSMSTFRRALRLYDLKGKKRESENKFLRDKDWLRDVYIIKQKSIRQIAQEINSTIGAVHSAIRHLGIKTRKAREALRLKYPSGRFGDKAANWKGGKIFAGRAKRYIYQHQPDHPHANTEGYVMEHRLVVEKQLGRYLDPKEIVHHKDGNTHNNNSRNLEVCKQGEHSRTHFSHAKENAGLKKEVERLRKIISDCQKCTEKLNS